MGLNSITLQNNDSDVISGDVLGRINWAASNDGDGPVATSVAASIYVAAEETFNATNNASSIVFSTANDAAASAKIKITSEGHILPNIDDTHDLGADTYYFRNIYGSTIYGDHEGPIVQECRNDTGSTITIGTPVYISGYYSSNGKPLIAPADASDPAKMPAIGLLGSTLTSGSEGQIHIFGILTQLNTSTFTVGQTVYVASGGGLTATKPTTATHLIQNIGRVLRSDNGQGRIMILGPGRTNDIPNSLAVNGTINAPNIGTGTDNSVVVLDSSGFFVTDEIDSRVWGTSLVDGSGSANHVAFWSDANSLTYDSSQLYWDSTNNRLGIGLNNPSQALDVVGSGNFSSNLSIGGHLSAATKSFLIDHPLKKGKKLQYGSLESPYHGVRLTGKDKLEEGVCVVKLPAYIKKLVQKNGINIQITNYKHSKTLYVDEIDLQKNSFTIKGHRCKKLEGLEFFWSFTAIRKDVQELQVEF